MTATATGQETLPPRQRFLDLHRSGQLAAEYPQVKRLLAELPDADLAQCGQLLARLDPADVLARHPAQASLAVAVTGHGTLSVLVPALTAELARHGLLLRPHLADFDGYVFDLSDVDSELYRAEPDLVLCVLDPAVVFDELPVPWTPDDVERVLGGKLALLRHLVERCAARTRATLVLNTLPLPRTYTAQLVDHRSRARLGAIWREANAKLLRLAEDHPSLVVLDLDPLIATGVPVTDPRMDVYAKAHLSAELLAAYAREAGHLGRQLAGRTKKALVLDLDDTMWGGVLSEDGPDGIEVDDGYRGEAFAAFRKVVKQLGSQGVLLAVVSKNDLGPVREVLREHPGMILREKDFVRVIANWRPKHDNLRELAETINLGVDSFVFVDDSSFECGLVRHSLPEVAVVPVDREPALHVTKLLRDGWFDVREVTGEDLARTERYRDELARKDFLDGFSSIDDYLRELGIEVRLAEAGEQQVARVSQMSLRTNQFNLTTRRLQQQDVRDLLTDPGHLVLTIGSSDRFGDNGIVGAVFYRRDGEVGYLDNVLLSCRVFSRGIEQACLSAVLRHARDTGARSVMGAYRASPKNGGVKDFYPRLGFAPAGSSPEEQVFRHDLADIVAVPEHVRLTERFGGTTA